MRRGGDIAASAVRIAALVGCVAVSVASSGPEEEDPSEPDSCSDPATTAFDSLEVGGGSDASFVPLADGSVVEIVVGGQGADMLTVRYRVQGAELPDCVTHDSRLRIGNADGEQISRVQAPLRIYADGDGATTNTLFLVLFGVRPEPGTPLFLSVTLGETTVERNLWVDEIGADAGP